MAQTKETGKQQLIDKANSSMVASVAIAGFLIMFSLVAGRALLSQRSYQARVIAEKEKAVVQLDSNIEAVSKLEISYKEFVGTPDNVIGGNPSGSGDRDGNNAKIVLDALPSKYDFPAFITSVEKLLADKSFPLRSIGGSDDELAQAEADSREPVEIPFQFETNLASYGSVRDLLSALELSIRPIKANQLTISGGDNELSLRVEAVSYFKPARGLTIEKQVVK